MDRLAAALADRYRIIREVGAGGMATVYLADDIRHGRQVALKVLRPELAATMGPERFFREIQVAARLQHPHILPLHDSGEAGGFLFFVMPFVTGESLRERLDRVNELPVPDVVRILTEVADALSYSHSQGVVHRDIKPDNVMLSGRHAVVTDFGVAKAVSDAKSNSTVTTAGVALGTPTYMAPEQAAADPQLDHRVDIYALGVMGYEMLAGRPPFTGMPPQQMLMAHVSTPPEPVRTHRPACPPDLEAVIMRCLAKRAADRYQSADEIVNALEPLSVSSGGITPAQTRPTPAVVTQPVDAVRRSPLLWLGIGVAIAASLATVFIATRDSDRDTAPTFERVQLTASGGATSGAISPDGQRFAYGQRVCNDERCTIDLRVQDVNGAGSTTLVTGMGLAPLIDWSADGRWITLLGSIGGRWGSYLIPAIGGEPRFTCVCFTTVAPDREMLVLSEPPNTLSASWKSRWIDIEDGTQRDSVIFPARLHGGTFQLAGTPNVLVHRLNGTQAQLWIVDRQGNPLDSLVPRNGTMFKLATRIVDDAVILAQQDVLSGLNDLLRISISGGNRFGPTTTIARQIPPGDVYVGHGGHVIMVHGAPEYSIWALERPSLETPAFTTKRVARSTAQLTGSITPSGDALLIAQTRPNEPAMTDFSLQPFGGGTGKTLGSQRGVVDWDFEQDGRGLLIARMAGTTLDVARLDVATAQASSLVTVPGDRLAMESIAGGGFVQVASISSFRLHGRPGRTDTTFAVNGIIGIAALEPSPDGRFVAVAGWELQGQNIVFQVINLADGGVREITRVRADVFDAITWLPDNTLFFSIGETQWTRAWYRLSIETGKLSREDIQLNFDATYRFARNGLRGIARERTVPSDVFLLRGLTVLGGR